MKRFRAFIGMTLAYKYLQWKIRNFSAVLGILRGKRSSDGWMLHELTIKEEWMLDSYIRKNMTMKGGRMLLEYKKSFKWAVIWWNKDQI